MIREDFYVLGGGRHVGNRHCAMMRLRHNLVIRQFYVDGGGGRFFWKLQTGGVSGQVWVEHPLSMATSLCFEFNGGGIKLLG